MCADEDVQNVLIKPRKREETRQRKRASSPARVADAGPITSEPLLPGDLPPKLTRSGEGETLSVCRKEDLAGAGLNPWELSPGGIDYPTGSYGVGHALTYISNLENATCMHNRVRSKCTQCNESEAGVRAGEGPEEAVGNWKHTRSPQASAPQIVWIPKTLLAQTRCSKSMQTPQVSHEGRDGKHVKQAAAQVSLLLPEEPDGPIGADPFAREVINCRWP